MLNFLWNFFFLIYCINVDEVHMNMRLWWEEEDEEREKKLGVGGSMWYTMDLPSNGQNNIKNIRH